MLGFLFASWRAQGVCATEVSWQSAFWSLVPLALSTMTQPAGQVLRYPPQLRTYLRSSPIICAFDALAQLIRVAAYLLTRCFGAPTYSVVRAMRIRKRALQDQGQASKVGFQVLENENATSIRWILFVFGALPQVIKLMALGGLPWTKAWGGLYLATFVVMECLIVIEERSGYDSIGIDSEIQESRSDMSKPALKRLEEHLERFESLCGSFGLVLQIGFLYWAFNALLHPFITIRFTNIFRVTHDEVLNTALVRLSSWFIYFGLIYFCFRICRSSPHTYRHYRSSFFSFRLFIFSGMTVALYAGAIFFMFNFDGSKKIMEDSLSFVLIILVYLGISCALWLLGCLMIAVLMLRRNILLVKDDGTGIGSSVAAWSLFIATLVLTVCYYTFRYEPKGTCKPRWTDSFG